MSASSWCWGFEPASPLQRLEKGARGYPPGFSWPPAAHTFPLPLSARLLRGAIATWRYASRARRPSSGKSTRPRRGRASRSHHRPRHCAPADGADYGADVADGGQSSRFLSSETREHGRDYEPECDEPELENGDGRESDRDRDRDRDRAHWIHGDADVCRALVRGCGCALSGVAARRPRLCDGAGAGAGDARGGGGAGLCVGPRAPLHVTTL